MSHKLLELAPNPRVDLCQRAELRTLRDYALNQLDTPEGPALLYSIAYTEGRIDAMRVLQGFNGEACPLPRFAGPSLPLLFQPTNACCELPFAGALPRSIEAQLHGDSGSQAAKPICFAAAGYAAGWYSGLLSRSVRVRETSCRAAGADACRFVADAADSDVADLLPFSELINFEELDSRAAALANTAELEGPMLGQFDPLSPAAHIWGPVMILPYSGQDDSVDALASIEGDCGFDRVCVVVLDLTGAQVGPLEANGIAHFLDHAEGMGLEAVLVGLDRKDTQPFQQPTLAMPICVQDLAEGIALGFQLSRLTIA